MTFQSEKPIWGRFQMNFPKNNKNIGCAAFADRQIVLRRQKFGNTAQKKLNNLSYLKEFNFVKYYFLVE